MTILAPIAAAVAAIVVLGGCIFILWGIWECCAAVLRVIAENGQQAVSEDPHG